MLFNLYGAAYTLSTASRTQRLPSTDNNKQHVLICRTFVSFIALMEIKKSLYNRNPMDSPSYFGGWGGLRRFAVGCGGGLYLHVRKLLCLRMRFEK